MKMCTVYEIRDCELMRIMRRSSNDILDEFIPIQQQRIHRQTSSGAGVRRALFRERIDHEATERYLRKQMSEIHAEARSRWNFDFGDDLPLRGRYEWTSVKDTSKIRETSERIEPAPLDSSSCSNVGDPDLVQNDQLTKKTLQTKMTDFAKQRKRPSSLSLKSQTTSSPSAKTIDTFMVSKRLKSEIPTAGSTSDGGESPSLTT